MLMTHFYLEQNGSVRTTYIMHILATPEKLPLKSCEPSDSNDKKSLKARK